MDSVRTNLMKNANHVIRRCYDIDNELFQVRGLLHDKLFQYIRQYSRRSLLSRHQVHVVLQMTVPIAIHMVKTFLDAVKEIKYAYVFKNRF